MLPAGLQRALRLASRPARPMPGISAVEEWFLSRPNPTAPRPQGPPGSGATLQNRRHRCWQGNGPGGGGRRATGRGNLQLIASPTTLAGVGLPTTGDPLLEAAPAAAGNDPHPSSARAPNPVDDRVLHRLLGRLKGGA